MAELREQYIDNILRVYDKESQGSREMLETLSLEELEELIVEIAIEESS